MTTASSAHRVGDGRRQGHDLLMMRLKDREHAATLLTERLVAYKDQHPPVLGVPRGGVPTARIIADALGA
jgi:hypothetical protein